MQALPAAFHALAAYRQFVTWFAAPNPDKPNKFNKFPCDYRTGEVVGSTHPETWTDAATALAHYQLWDRGHGAGIGFCFTPDDPFYFLDIDGALQPDGQWSPLAQQLCTALAGAAMEVSHSGKGLHVIGTVAKPLAHGTRNTPLGLELYTGGRFVALTGINAQGDASAPGGAVLVDMVAQLFPAAAPAQGAVGALWTTEPVPEWGGPADDAELIRLALAASAKSAAGAFGGKETFADLWAGRVDEARRSEADQSLANHLAFWTGKNCERIERLMAQSALYRDKWDEARPLPDGTAGTWLQRTIVRACSFVSSVAQGRPTTPAAADMQAGEYVPAHALGDFFHNCFYVTQRKEVFCADRDEMAGSTVFDILYGGHVFLLDIAGAKKTESAFEAFTQNRVTRPAIVRDIVFRPELAMGEVVTDGRFSYVNSYVPYECRTLAGDPSPFTNHLAKLIPNERDRLLFTSYLAAMAQNPGVKFQWCPVLQGAEGNGKTIIIEEMAYIMGEHFTFRPNSGAMVKDGLKFNAWMDRKLFIGIEEFNANPNRDFLEEFKTMITNERTPSEAKGVMPKQIDNRANFIICTNLNDGIPIKRDKRRYGIWYTAQQSEDDIIRDGMGGDYFPRLWDWFKADGRAIVAHYLKTYAIPHEMNPAGALHRAPKTSSTEEAIQKSQGAIEQEIVDAIEEGKPGFAGGWVSSKALDTLLEHKRLRLALSRRRELMQGLGYDWHPALANGRVDNIVMPDNGKPKLYIKTLHPALGLSKPADIAKAYTEAQAPQVATLGEVIPFARR